MCAGNTLPGETYITVTPAGIIGLQKERAECRHVIVLEKIDFQEAVFLHSYLAE